MKRDFEYLTTESYDDGAIARIMLNRPETPQRAEPRAAGRARRRVPRAEADDQRARRDPRRRRADASPPATTWARKEAMAERTAGPTSTLGNDQRRAPARAPRTACCRSGTTSSRTRCAGATCARSPSPQVQGTVYAAGLMLMWACDLIVAADDAEFADVVGTRLGMCGVEYFAHPWEFGPRKTKELMLTGDSHRRRGGAPARAWSARCSPRRARGPDPRVRPPHRQAPDDDRAADQGVGEPDRRTTRASTTRCNACFTLHQLNHSHWAELTAREAATGEPAGMPNWRAAGPVLPAQVGAP